MSWRAVGAAEVEAVTEHGVRLRAGAALVQVVALAPDLFRVGLFPDGRPAEYRSEAVARDGWPAAGEWRDGELVTPEATAHVELDPLRISFSDAHGTFAADDPGLEIGDGLLRLRKALGEGERLFGCGERTGGLEKTGSHQLFWNIDPPEGHSASMNNLYTSIPFALSLRGGVARGLFVDHPGRSEMDLAKADPERIEATVSGTLVYYVLAGPTPRKVLERYTELTGRIGMPPLWALGNHQSRWGYETADEIREVAASFRERGIPCDVIHFDIEHMDGHRVFTWDPERFPDPRGLIGELRADGFRVVCITDPGVKVDEGYELYTSGRERGLFCRDARGGEFRNVVWPGLCAFPDFTDPAAREWWGSHQASLLELGVSGVWCDMDEPALFVPDRATMPDDVAHHDGRRHVEVHNAYGSCMARAAFEGMRRTRPERRPFVITRAGYAGLQKHAMQWTGDNSSWWEHLWMSMPQLQNLGLSGVAFCGVDVGGFFDDCHGELLARWTEFGVFQPFCRNHSCKGTAQQEPWAFGEPWESVCRDMIRLRMRLLPYLYALFDEAARTGAPVLRPLLFEHPDDPVGYTADDQMLVGDALLVAPITRPGVEHRHVYLPAGTWAHWFTGELIEGPAHVLAHAPLGTPAVYARANAAVPLWPALETTAGGTPGELTLRVYAAPGAGAVERGLYEDEGDGYGAVARRTAWCDGTTLRLSAREGSYEAPRDRLQIEVFGGATHELAETGEAAEIAIGLPSTDGS